MCGVPAGRAGTLTHFQRAEEDHLVMTKLWHLAAKELQHRAPGVASAWAKAGLICAHAAALGAISPCHGVMA